jgi:hypothetical protein
MWNERVLAHVNLWRQSVLKRLVAGSISLVMMVGVMLTSGSSAEAGARIPSTVANFGLILNESFDLNLEGDAFYANADDPDSKNVRLCASVDDKLCTDSTNVHVIHNLPVCSVDNSFDCIASVWATNAAGKRIQGVYQKALPLNSANDHDAIPSMQLSAARGLGGLWKIPGVTNAGGEDNYFVSMRNDFWAMKSAGVELKTQKVYYGQLMAGIIPVKQISGNYRAMTSGDSRMPGHRGWGSTGPSLTPDGDRCAVADTGICEAPRLFPEGYRFGMSVRLTQSVSGWFHGRVALPIIDGKTLGNRKEIAIEAEPVTISTLDFTVPNAQIPDSVRKVVFSDAEWGISGDLVNTAQTNMQGLSDPLTMEVMTAMLPVIGDKATKSTQYWAYRALNAWKNPEVQKCSERTGTLGGVVTTNALTYSAGPPTYDKETESLDYKVASPHYAADGKVALGTYDLAIRSDVARCIYGFSNAPIKASISIVGENGEQKIATTVINEKDGWMYMSAKGFTFSNPTIKVKFTQVKASKTLTINCVKGKTTKKVTATAPKCPKGFVAKK